MQIQTTTQSSVNQQGRSQEDTPRNQPLPQTKALTIKTLFETLRIFNEASRRDENITSSAQLIYRLLIDEMNRSRWQDRFICSLDELCKISHLSRPTVIDARMRLKSKGFIDFYGKPSKYTMYSLVDSPLYYKLYHSGDSCNTGIQEYNTTFKKEETSKKKEGAKRDIHDAILDTDWANSPELDELLS